MAQHRTTPDFLKRLDDLFWVRLPARAAQVSAALESAITDGDYLAVWPTVGALVMPLAVLVGFYLGYVHVADYPSGALHYLYSPTTLLVFVILSQHGAAVGAAMLLGYAVGDALVYLPTSGARFGQVAAARILADSVLALLVVSIPLAVKRLASGSAPAVGKLIGFVRRGLDLPAADEESDATRAGLHALVAFLLVYLWMHTAGLLLQAVYTWSGVSPLTHSLVVTLHSGAMMPALVAAYVAGVRAVLETVSAASRELATRRALIPRASIDLAARHPWLDRLARDGLKSAWLTFTLGSLWQSLAEAIGLFALFAAILAVRSLLPGFLPVSLQRFSRIPVAARVAAAFVVVYFAAMQRLGETWNAGNPYSPAMASAILALIAFAVALPARTPPASRPHAIAPVMAALLIIIIMMPDLAFAGYCTSLPNCFGDPGGPERFSLGVALMAALVAPDRDPSRDATVRIMRPDDLTIQVCGAEISFAAQTDPPGREADIQWEVPSGQQQTVSSGQGSHFTTGWRETGVKQVIARLDDCRDDVILYLFKTEAGGGTVRDLLGVAAPAEKGGERDYKWYREHGLPADVEA